MTPMGMTSSEFADEVRSLADSPEPMGARLMPLFSRAFGSGVAMHHHRVASPLWLACLRYLRDPVIENRRRVRAEFTDGSMHPLPEDEGTD